MKVVAYSKPHAGVDGRTLFQITTYDFGSSLEGMPVSGVMYCVVIGTTVVTLHTQGVDDAPLENRRAAMEAFEALRVNVSN